MSEERNTTADLSRIVGLIMENPKLIEEIASLARGEREAEATPDKSVSEPESEDAVSEVDAVPKADGRERRAKLLNALKPYVSEGRARAIDSMLTITDMLEVMKGR